MSERLKSKIDHMLLLAGALLMLYVGSAWAFHPALESVESILQKRAQATEDDKKLAAGLMQDGKRAGRDPDYYGPQIKTWCGAAVTYPEVESLVECARVKLEGIKEASNLVLPLDEACKRTAQRALVLLQAAERLLQEGGVPEELAERIGRDKARYQRIIDNPEGACS